MIIGLASLIADSAWTSRLTADLNFAAFTFAPNKEDALFSVPTSSARWMDLDI
jgi:hypothetical protein